MTRPRDTLAGKSLASMTRLKLHSSWLFFRRFMLIWLTHSFLIFTISTPFLQIICTGYLKSSMLTYFPRSDRYVWYLYWHWPDMDMKAVKSGPSLDKDTQEHFFQIYTPKILLLNNIFLRDIQWFWMLQRTGETKRKDIDIRLRPFVSITWCPTYYVSKNDLASI